MSKQRPQDAVSIISFSSSTVAPLQKLPPILFGSATNGLFSISALCSLKDESCFAHHRVARVAGHDEVALRGAAHLDLHMGLLADEQHQRVDAGVHRHLREGRQGKKCT